MSSKMDRFEQLQRGCYNICKAKNEDYGDSTKITQEILGPTSHLTRMFDKLMRVNNIIKGNAIKVTDERLQDTLMDLANYALLMIIDLDLDKEDLNANTNSEPQPTGLIKRRDCVYTNSPKSNEPNTNAGDITRHPKH